MKATALSIAVFSLCAFGHAQANDEVPQRKADKQDPEVVREATPAERIAKLKAEIAKLQGELQALQRADEAGGIPARVKTLLGRRTLLSKSFSDPNPPKASTGPAPAAPMNMKKVARLLGDAEKEGLAADVIFTVDGQAVSKSEFDGAVAYLKSYPRSSDDDDALRQQAVMELVRMKAAMAAFPETGQNAHTRILEIQQQLAGDQDFADVAQSSSDCPSKARGGDLGYFGRVGMDFWFTKAAFSLDVGEVSKVIPTSFGYHLIKVTGKEKGESGDQDRVKASHILTLYGDQGQLAQVSRRANSGQADLAFVSDEYRKFAPAAYK